MDIKNRLGLIHIESSSENGDSLILLNIREAMAVVAALEHAIKNGGGQ